MRGKGRLCCGFDPQGGITPAHAGKSATPSPTTSTSRDHPRTCGEKLSNQYDQAAQAGSPPHMRGKVNAGPVDGRRAGITPAHAGKRNRCGNRRSPLRDHPRTCGEKTQKALKYKHLFFQVLIFHLTSDRSQVSVHSLSVLDGSQSHPVLNKRILPQGNNCSAWQVSVGPASGYLCTGFLVSATPLFYSQPGGNRNRMQHDTAPTGQNR